MKRLAIITTHPIQYNAPLFRLMANQKIIHPKVFYTWSQAKDKVEDKGFGKTIQWDIPLLEGYEYQFLNNHAKKPGNRSFFGIDNHDIISKIKTWKPDAILVFGWNFKSHLQVMRHFKGKIPVWFRGDSHLLDETPGLKTLARRIFLKWVYSHVDKAFYVGINNKNYYLKHGLKESQLIFAPHAINNEFFYDDDVKKYEQRAAEWRKELGYKENDIVLLFAGKFDQNKQPELLIKAIHKLHKENVYDYPIKLLKLLLAGTGPLEYELKKLAGNSPYIQFLSFQNQSQMPVLYRVGNIFCLLSLSETWGLGVNESLACGRPVLVSHKVGCAIDLVIEGKNGFVFTSGSQDSLISKLEIFLKTKHDFRNQSLASVSDWNYQAIIEAIYQSFGIKS